MLFKEHHRFPWKNAVLVASLDIFSSLFFLINSLFFLFLPGLAVMSRLARNRLQNSGDSFEVRSIDWDTVEM